MTTTIYIAPAMTPQAGQCRIYACEGPMIRSARDHYRTFPGLWKEVGIMNSRGNLVCFKGTPKQREDLTNDQPLMAGITYTYEDEESTHATNP